MERRDDSSRAGGSEIVSDAHSHSSGIYWRDGEMAKSRFVGVQKKYSCSIKLRAKESVWWTSNASNASSTYQYTTVYVKVSCGFSLVRKETEAYLCAITSLEGRKRVVSDNYHMKQACACHGSDMRVQSPTHDHIWHNTNKQKRQESISTQGWKSAPPPSHHRPKSETITNHP